MAMHYWSNDQLTPERWETLAAVYKSVMVNCPDTILLQNGDEAPLRGEIISLRPDGTFATVDFMNPTTHKNDAGDCYIDFNGAGNTGAQPFLMSTRQPAGNSKIDTKGQPYDLLVRMFLILAEHHLPDVFEVDSESPVSEWEYAITFVRRFQKNAQLPRKIRARAPAQLISISPPAGMDFRS